MNREMPKPMMDDIEGWKHWAEQNGLKPCPDCEDGEIEILDEDNIREWTITPPYKKIPCENCEGKGWIEK